MHTESSYPFLYTRSHSFPQILYIHGVKRPLDVLLAILVLAASLPLLLILSVAIKWDSKGPVFFNQMRYGKDGKLFRIYKFRTMLTSAPREGRSPVTDTDPRITRVGRILRKTSLDELPQLINILKGEMSFVGPRPEQKSIVDAYYGETERQRFLVTPGITGLWQISPDRCAPIHVNLHHDFHYIKHISLGLDLNILFRTVGVMFKSNTV